MRHQRTGKKLGRDSAHRRALYSNLAGALIEHGRIKTTVAKAKAVRPIAEQMITLGKRGDLHARRQAVAFLRSKDVVHKLFDEVGPSFATRPGGYTRIIRIGPRPGDASEMAYLELIDTPHIPKETLPSEPTRGAKTAAAPADSGNAPAVGEAAAETESAADDESAAQSAVEPEAETETADPQASASDASEEAGEEPEAGEEDESPAQ